MTQCVQNTTCTQYLVDINIHPPSIKSSQLCHYCLLFLSHCCIFIIFTTTTSTKSVKWQRRSGAVLWMRKKHFLHLRAEHNRATLKICFSLLIVLLVALYVPLRKLNLRRQSVLVNSVRRNQSVQRISFWLTSSISQ